MCLYLKQNLNGARENLQGTRRAVELMDSKAGEVRDGRVAADNTALLKGDSAEGIKGDTKGDTKEDTKAVLREVLRVDTRGRPDSNTDNREAAITEMPVLKGKWNTAASIRAAARRLNVWTAIRMGRLEGVK